MKIVECSKVFESNVRLQMLVSLAMGSLTQNQLVEICNSTSGAIATHTKKLVAEEFITITKEFVNNKPRTTYTLTDKGRKELIEYVKLLQKLILNEGANEDEKVIEGLNGLSYSV